MQVVANNPMAADEKDDGDEGLETDLAPHKHLIMQKLTKLNRQSLESLIAILE